MTNGSNHKREDASAKRPVAGIIAAGVVALVLGVGAVSAIVVAVNDDAGPTEGTGAAASASEDGTQAGDVSASPSESAGASAGESAGEQPGESTGAVNATLKKCRGELKSADKVVKAARTGIRHLKVHIGAHQAWISGQITEDKKSATYKRTRLLGPGDLERYANALTSYADADANAAETCASQSGDCKRRSRALGASLAAGDQGIAHWDQHLTNMADFAAGEFDATRAQQLWDQTRAQMPQMTRPWNKAERKLDRAPRCA